MFFPVVTRSLPVDYQYFTTGLPKASQWKRPGSPRGSGEMHVEILIKYFLKCCKCQLHEYFSELHKTVSLCHGVVSRKNPSLLQVSSIDKSLNTFSFSKLTPGKLIKVYMY